MGPDALAHVLRPLAEMFPQSEYPDLLVGLAQPDDAAVYRRSDDEALVFTVDFFPPIVDDPSDYGAIAAANAMSDVFAMGAEVILALNVAAFPEDLPSQVVADIIRSGAAAVRLAGGVIAGGHTVLDTEPKYGLAVLGRIDPRRILRKSGAKPGDVLLLTKPVGTGLISTALRAGAAQPEHVEAATRSMRRLNLEAARAAVAGGAHAVTDITGFGLVGHAAEMAAASGVEFVMNLNDVPLLPGSTDYAERGFAPGGTQRNRDAFRDRCAVQGTLSPAWDQLVHDPQTSGGLLMALDRSDLAGVLARLRGAGEDAWQIGEVRAGAGVTLVAGGSAGSRTTDR